MKELKTTFDIDFSGMILNDSRYEIAPFKKTSEMTLTEAISDEEMGKMKTNRGPVLIHKIGLDSDDYSTGNVIRYTEKIFSYKEPKIDFKIFEPAPFILDKIQDESLINKEFENKIFISQTPRIDVYLKDDKKKLY
jgi:hypothetical protein